MIPESIRTQFVDSLRSGRYSLLLGAGYSASSTSADGTPLPVGDSLRDELAAQFSLEPYYPLPALCSAIPPEKLNAFFQTRFKGCRASEGARRIARFVWKYIYSFNVDDVLASAYSYPDALQKPKLLTYKHQFYQSADQAEIPTVYLHGSVHEPTHGYVFSPHEYGYASASDSTWFTIASDQLATQPFIVLGSNHFQEADLEFYLARRKGLPADAPQLAPSLFVSKTIDRVKKTNCEQRGLIPIEASSDDFLAELERLIGRARTPLELALPNDPGSLFKARPPEATTRVFFRQWLYVRPAELPPDAPDVVDTHLLTGTEPRWSQIARDDDVVRSNTRSLLDDVARWRHNAPKEATFQFLSSPPGDGKSTLLMRVALELGKSGETALWYHSRERMSVDPTAEAIAQCKQAPILFIDHAAEHGHQIADLIRTLRKAEIGAFIVAADRSSRMKRLENAFPDPVTEMRLRHLAFAEATAMVNKMRPLGLLGMRAGKDTKELAGSVVNHSWFVGTVLLNKNSASVATVISQELLECDPVSRRIYAVVSLAHQCGYPVRLAIIQRAAKASLAEVTERLKGPLRGLIKGLPPHGDFRETRHRLVAEAVVRGLSEADRFEAFKALASALAPYVNRHTLIAGTEEARLAGRLLDFDNLLQELLSPAAIESFYLGIRSDWEWNSRYWEQLALLKLGRDPAEALRYAETAVGIEIHPVPLTTLAKVRFRLAKANGLTPAGLHDLREGIDKAKRAVDIGKGWRRRDVHPVDVGLRGITDFIRAVPPKDRAGMPMDVMAAGDWFAQEATELFKLREQTDLLVVWRGVKSGATRALPPHPSQRPASSPRRGGGKGRAR